MDTVLTAQGKHREIPGRGSDLLVVRLFFVSEELKRGLGRASGALGWFYRRSLRRARVSVGERSLHRYQVAHGTEGKGARGQNRPLLQNKKQRVRKKLSAPVSQMDLNGGGMLEERCCIGCLAPMMGPACVWLGSGISKDFGDLCRPCEWNTGQKGQRFSYAGLPVTLRGWKHCPPAEIPAWLTAASADSQRTATEGRKILDVGSCPFGFCVDYQGQCWHPAFLLRAHQQLHFLLFADTTVIFTATGCSYTKRGLWVQVQKKKIAAAGVGELFEEGRCYFSCKCC